MSLSNCESDLFLVKLVDMIWVTFVLDMSIDSSGLNIEKTVSVRKLPEPGFLGKRKK